MIKISGAVFDKNLIGKVVFDVTGELRSGNKNSMENGLYSDYSDSVQTLLSHFH